MVFSVTNELRIRPARSP